MATAAQVATLTRGFDDIERRIRADIRRMLPRLRTYSPEAARDAFIELAPMLTNRYGEVAAVIGAEYFEEVTGAMARIAALTDEDQVVGSVRALAGDFWTADREAAFHRMATSITRHALQPGRTTIAESSTRAGLVYARAPEPGACAWCIMISSRGAVYGSRRAAGARDAGNEFHDNCRCAQEPVKPGDELSYDSDALYRQYQQAIDNHALDPVAALRKEFGYK